MSDEVRIGSLRLKFLIDDAANGGKLTMFDMALREGACDTRAKLAIYSETACSRSGKAHQSSSSRATRIEERWHDGGRTSDRSFYFTLNASSSARNARE
jgi:hypothetical protein